MRFPLTGPFSILACPGRLASPVKIMEISKLKAHVHQK